MKPPVPIIAVNGFLESGKTFFLNDAIREETFIDSIARGVLIVCEEGNNEFDQRVLENNHISLVTVEDEGSLNSEFFDAILKKYRPDIIYIEQNAMWDKSAYDYPPMVELAQQLTVVNAQTFLPYFNNMRGKVSEMLALSDAVIMYGCDNESEVTGIKRSLQLINQRLGFLLFNSEGDTISLADDLPYSVDTDYINVEDLDWGIFYVDSYENPTRYNGKTVEVTIKAVLDKSIPDGYFVGGRRVMTCCADDVQFLGVVCLNKTSSRIVSGEFLRVTGEVSYKLVDDGPHMLLTIISVKHLADRGDEVLGIQ